MSKYDFIELNKKYKSYKEVCNVLNEKVKGGESKKAQLKEWSRYLEWKKEGNSFTFIEKFTNPKDKVDGRSEGNNVIYCNDIQYLVTCLLIEKNTDEVVYSCGELLKELSMVNNKYLFGRKNVPLLSKQINIDKPMIYDFYNNAYSSLRSKLETSLNSLRRKSLISWKKITKIHKEIIEIEKNEVGNPKRIDGNIIYNTHDVYSKATKEEEKMIIELELDVMKSMGYYDKRDVFFNGKYNKFITNVNKELYKRANITYYYSAYEILYNIKDIQDFLLSITKDEDVKYILNKKIQESLIKSSETRQKNIIEKTKNMIGKKKINVQEKIRLDKNYVDSNKKLVNFLIKKD